MIVFAVFLAASLIFSYWLFFRRRRWRKIADEDYYLREDLKFFLDCLTKIYSKLPVMRYGEGDEWKAGSPAATRVQTRHYEKMRLLWKKASNSLQESLEIFLQFQVFFGLPGKEAKRIAGLLNEVRKIFELLDSELREYNQLYPPS